VDAGDVNTPSGSDKCAVYSIELVPAARLKALVDD
jgi:hypothetical protein